MKPTEKNIINIFLWSFVVIGGLLRFYNLGEWSLTNDELSALNRTQHDSNLALWLSYASVPDTHPPFSQFFIYNWTLLFGTSPFLLRLPFAIMGILSIPLSYRLFNRWFSPTTGILVAGSIAFLNYPIVYTQLARPYGIGLFFGLLFTYYWTKLIISGRYTAKTYLLYVLFGILSIYIHYFLTLTVAIAVITGLFLIKQHRFKTYLILNLIIGVAFLPFFKYFLLQLNVGGVGGWLPTPENSFYLDYLFYAFNRSWLVILLICFTITYGIRNKVALRKRNLVMLLWALIPFAIGFFYSKHSNPVLQFSTLLFSFPYILGFVFSFAESLELKRNINRLIAIVSIVFVFSSAINWKYYHESSFGEFKETTQTLSEWTKEMNSSYDVIANIVDPFYYNYYLKQMNWEDTFLLTSITTHADLAKLSHHLEKSAKESLVFTWANTNNPFELKELIRYYYPSIKNNKRLNNAEVMVFHEGEGSATQFKYSTTFDEEIEEFGYDKAHLNIDSISGNTYYSIQKNEEYPVVVKDIVGNNLALDSSNVITFLVHFKATKKPKGILAISIDNEDGNVDWRGTDLAPFYQKDKWNMALVSLYLPDGISPTDKIKAYVWNKEKDEFLLDDISFFAYKNSQYYLK